MNSIWRASWIAARVRAGLTQAEVSYVRIYAQQHEIYVVTGPIFGDEKPNGWPNMQVAVPWELFKAVYDPEVKGAVAVVSLNAEGRICHSVTIDQLKKVLHGTDVFPQAEISNTMLSIYALQKLCPFNSR